MLARWLQRVARVEADEVRPVAAGFLLFFCVLCGYFMLRPVRETIGTVLGEAEVEKLFAMTFFASVAVIPLYGFACSRLPRAVVLTSVYAIFGVSLLVLAAVMNVDPDNVHAARFFYVWISVFNLFVVSVFWTLMVDRSTSEQAKRLFGVIAAGGTIGALAAPQITNILIDPIGKTGVLLVSATLFGAAIVCQLVLLKSWRRPNRPLSEEPARERPIGGNPFAGITQVIRSPYLLGFCGFVLLLASTTTFLYFEQLRLVTEAFPDENDRTQAFAWLDFTVNALTLITQVFFTGRIATRLGVVVLLVSVPLVMVGGFFTLAFLGNFWVLAVVMVARRAGEYALTRPGREILFTSVDTETKYKAKNLIDVVVYRGGDALSAWLRKGLKASGMSFSAIALVGAGIALAWALVGFWLAKRHESRAAPDASVARQPA
ncbi:MAG TPA: MFS transporter [Steroidobacteraceae bacterium]|nr:MFS transporter [Steroidobacteraceae bacterium]